MRAAPNSFLRDPELVDLAFGPDKIRKSREFVVCIDPDQRRLIGWLLDMIEDLQARLAKIEGSHAARNHGRLNGDHDQHGN